MIKWTCPSCRRAFDLPDAAFPLTCVCGFDAKTPSDSLQGAGPGAARRAVNFTKAAFSHVALGGTRATQEERERRFSICESCDKHYNGTACTHPQCGCMIGNKEAFVDKLSWEEQRCPLGRWHRPEYVTLERLAQDCRVLAAKLPPDLAGVVGVARSGMHPATVLAMLLHVPLYALRSTHGDIIDAGRGWRLGDRSPGGPLVVVDDTRMTGRSLSRAQAIVAQHLLDRDVRYAVVYRNPRVKQLPQISYYARDLEPPHFLEWNMYNSIHAPHLATCAETLLRYPMLRAPVKLVLAVGDRMAAEAALAARGMSAERLETHPGGDGDALARWKAGVLDGTRLTYYVEDDDAQARQVAGLTGRIVICPTSRAVY